MFAVLPDGIDDEVEAIEGFTQGAAATPTRPGPRYKPACKR
jgi:hypothetical protein